jgi:hypothetical protein
MHGLFERSMKAGKGFAALSSGGFGGNKAP